MKLIQVIKSSKIYNYFLDVYRYPQMVWFVKRIQNLPQNAIILVGTPAHKNLGDHLIAYSEIKFLKQCFPNVQIFEIPTHVFTRYENEISKSISGMNRVFITGGGWMGNLWPNDDETLQKMLRVFKKMPIVILPQTIYYDFSDRSGKQILNSEEQAILDCSDIKITVRDVQSYENALKFKGVLKEQVLLCPDIALYYDSSFEYKDNLHMRVGLYLRQDREKTSSSDAIKSIEEMIIDYGYEVYDSDTMAKHLVPIPQREKAILNLISEMRGYDMIVTDRLHAVIYSVIAGVKCIALDNKTHKVIGVYEKWLKDNPNILMLIDNEIDKDKVCKFIEQDTKQFDNRDILDGFNRLTHFVR